MSTLRKKFTIRVPATSANIGPGFDVLGLCLSLFLTLTVTVDDTRLPGPPLLKYSGEGAKTVSLDPYKNLITRVALYVLRCHRISIFPRGVLIEVHNEIPFGRGLGSSGAAVIAGVELANAIANLDLPLSRKLDFMLMVERHPDNVTAALVGGFVGSYLRGLDIAAMEAKSVPLHEVLPDCPPHVGDSWSWDPPLPPMGIGNYIKFNWAKEIKALVIIPEFQVSTEKARDVLPVSYSRNDVIFNLQRLALLTTALGRSPPNSELIYEAMKDCLHQPYRTELVTGLKEVVEKITLDTHKGLLGICLSGSGPTILILATGEHEKIAEDVRKIFSGLVIKVECKVLEVCDGASVMFHK